MPDIYQLRLVLRDISPLIWRRLLVRSNTSIAQLHAMIQTAMGWSDSHLHRFVIHGKGYGVARLDGIGFADDPHRVRLADFRLRCGERFRYEYDFTDGWELDIRVEQILAFDPERVYPHCTAGRRAAPPEDFGGPWAYLARLDRFELDSWEALAHLAELVLPPSCGEHRDPVDEDDVRDALDMVAARARFTPQRFNRSAVNAELGMLSPDSGGA